MVSMVTDVNTTEVCMLFTDVGDIDYPAFLAAALMRLQKGKVLTDTHTGNRCSVNKCFHKVSIFPFLFPFSFFLPTLIPPSILLLPSICNLVSNLVPLPSFFTSFLFSFSTLPYLPSPLLVHLPSFSFPHASCSFFLFVPPPRLLFPSLPFVSILSLLSSSTFVPPFHLSSSSLTFSILLLLCLLTSSPCLILLLSPPLLSSISFIRPLFPSYL